MCQSNILVNVRIHGFPEELYPEHRTAGSGLPSYHSAFCCHFSSGKWNILTCSSTFCKRKCDSLDQATYFHCFRLLVLLLTSILVVDIGQHEHSDRFVAMQPHAQQTVIHCVIWHISKQRKLFQATSRTSLCFPRTSTRFVCPLRCHGLSFNGPLLVGTISSEYQEQDLLFWRFSDPVVYHSLARAHFTCFKHINFQNWLLTVMRSLMISVIHLTWLNIFG